MLFGVILCLLFVGSASSGGGGTTEPENYSINLETRLRSMLFNGYEPLQRPSENIQVNISLNLITVNNLEIKDQKLSTSGFFQMQWTDSRLEWNSTYGNIRFMFSTETYVWTPKIAIENSVNDLEVFSDENSLIRLISTGKALWTPGGVFETSCDADVTYYPLDTQECSITLTTWAYTSNEITLGFLNTSFMLDNYQENGEWELVGTSSSRESAQRSKEESYTYDRLRFTMKLKRRPLYHILNTIFPVILMSCLIVFVFKLPPESGERVGMSLTVLLAYAVYLTLIADNIPRTSTSASILSSYLTIILMLSTLSVVFTIVVLDIYFNHADDETPPSWLQNLTRHFLVKVTCWKGVTCCSKPKVSPGGDGEILTLNEITEKSETKDKWALDDERSKVAEGVGIKFFSWKEVALILDRFFMHTFIFLVASSTVICMIILSSA
ncbi:acetylcholine receptor subunit beta-like isoform X1 [Dreissena polymorpha]|uniref:acetylcholine receptor subunit beta-like isoform X1 n=1 Tax=Dreissena polymorpha TaxID=45954 RepID=UPI002264DF85|nr:acetylcholine receptor subunit beta-like isoform X1 [Dreissena polymorpha]